MTTFEKDKAAIQEDVANAYDILKARKAELQRIEREGRACKNGFRRQCLEQEYARRAAEYRKLDELLG